MFDWRTLRAILTDTKPSIPNLALTSSEELSDQGLTMGTLFLGRPGTGKTSALAKHLVEYLKKYPNQAIFVLDWSGSITDNLLNCILHEKDRDRLIRRIVYDDMGNPEWVMPLPEFSPEYGDYEDQVSRVSENLKRLADSLVKKAPVVGGLSLTEVGPETFKLLTAITNENDECWQVTETKRLLKDEALLKAALNRYGYKVSSKWWFEKEYLPATAHDKRLMTYALISMLAAIESKEIRARVGYYRPGWTPKEAIDKGLLVLVDGARLINRGLTQHYLFTQVYSLIMAEVKTRRPADPQDLPVSIVMDEIYSLLQIPGMAPEISQLSAQYRSRKLQLYIVLQELAQLSRELEEHVWSIGNVVSFAVSNFDEAFDLARQIFKYEPRMEKLPPKDPKHQPILEPDRGQYLEITNWIQRLAHRQCIVKSYRSEQVLEKYVRFVPKTREIPTTPTDESLVDLKDRLLKERAVRVRDALEVINNRKIVDRPSARPEL
jgi:hypothetical protein